MNKKQPYQLFGRLRPEEFEALRADIAARGVSVAVEYDEDGNILDGHHRAEIAGKLGIKFPKVVRRFKTEAEKREHVIKLNLARRHLDPIRWGLAFAQLLDAAGVERQRGPKTQGANAATVAEIAQKAGVSERTARHRVALAEQYQALPAPLRKAIDAGENTLTEARRVQSRADLPAKCAALPVGKYRVIYADPPWKYGDERTGLVDYAASAAADHYPTMSVAELCALDVESMAPDDGVLFCWATFPLLPDALEVVEAWGYEYKTAIVWDKKRPNMGNYHDASAELLLICTRGSCVPEIDDRVGQIQTIPRGKHSAKPEEFRALIDRLYPTGPRVELFRRGDAPKGWKVWGNEADG